MSQKIVDVLEVLARMRIGHLPGRPDSIWEARIRALHSIAAERGVTHQAIGDAYLRRLEPEIKGTRAFDRLVHEWLDENSPALKGVLQSKALDRSDESAIDKFFA